MLETPDAKAKFLAFMGYDAEAIADAIRGECDDPLTLAKIAVGLHELNEAEEERRLERYSRSVQAEHDLSRTNWR